MPLIGSHWSSVRTKQSFADVFQKKVSWKFHQFYRKTSVCESLFIVKLVTLLRTLLSYGTPQVAASDLSFVQIPKLQGLIVSTVFFYFSPLFVFYFFSIRVFFHGHWRFTGQQGKGEDHLLFHSTTSTRSRTLRYLFATLHVRWLSRTFNRNACVYQTATRWDLPPNRITIWLIDWWCNVCLLLDELILGLSYSDFDMGNRWIWTRIYW